MTAKQEVQPGHVVMFSDMELQGSNVTDISVDATGGEIDCLLLNEKGKVVAKDESKGNSCRIRFAPRKTSRYTLLVTNIDPNGPAIAQVVIQ